MVVKKRGGAWHQLFDMWLQRFLSCRRTLYLNLVEAAFSACVNRARRFSITLAWRSTACRLVPWGCFWRKNLLIFGFCLSNLTRIRKAVPVANANQGSQVPLNKVLHHRDSPTVAPRLLSRWKMRSIVYKRLIPLPNRKDQPVSRCAESRLESRDLGSFNPNVLSVGLNECSSAPWTRSCCSWERLGNRRAIKSDKWLNRVCTLHSSPEPTKQVGSCTFAFKIEASSVETIGMFE